MVEVNVFLIIVAVVVPIVVVATLACNYQHFSPNLFSVRDILYFRFYKILSLAQYVDCC